MSQKIRTKYFLEPNWLHGQRRLRVKIGNTMILGAVIMLSLVLSVDGDFYGKEKGDTNRLCFCQVRTKYLNRKINL